MYRKDFLRNCFLSVGTCLVMPFEMRGNTESQPVIGANLTKEFVIAGHKDLTLVQEMLMEFPYLIHASYDWGNGDFETAIEGAGHVGNKEIANYLISVGARVNLFVLTMLGKSDLVLPVFEEYPDLLTSSGPHGFSLLHHAKIGGDEAREIYDYLLDRGITETKWI